VNARSLVRLAARNVAAGGYRSWLIGFCALVVAGFLLATVLLLRGAQESLSLARDRLGADVVVVPRGSESRLESALLMGNPTNTYVPTRYVGKVRAIPGVAAASPQLYLISMSDSSCCAVPGMFMVAYDPASDFTLKPWLKEELGTPLKVGQAIGGTHVFTPAGKTRIKLYGYPVRLMGTMSPTGTNLDQTIFFSFATAKAMYERSLTKAKAPLPLYKDGVSSILVKVDEGADKDAVAKSIMAAMPDVSALSSPRMFSNYRSQYDSMTRIMLIVLGLTLVLSLAVMALIFSIAVNERRRQIGVLRALGATQRVVLASFMTEAAMLALAGGVVGVVLTAVCMRLFRDLLVGTLDLPFLFPSVWSLVGLVLAGLLLALAVVAVAALIPALRISRQEPAVSMRE